jgi:hypothetical protein
MQAQWNVYDSGKEYQVLVSTAQGQPAIYKNVPCEVKLVSLKNKTLKLTSSNATVTPNAEPGSFTIQTSDENAVLQIYSAKKSKMKLLKEIQIRTVDVPLLDELTLSGNSLSVGYSYNMQFASGYDPSPYDQQVFSKYYSLESWAFSCPAARKNLYGSGNQLSQEVTSFLRYLPEGVSYEIIGYHNGPINPGDYQANVPQSFASQNSELPGAKYVVLNNTPANKSFFDPNDPNSLIGLVNNNYFSFPDLDKGVFFTSKSTPENGGEFILANKVNSGIKDFIPPNFKTVFVMGPTRDKVVYDKNTNFDVPVYVLKGQDPLKIKIYTSMDRDLATQIDNSTETIDPQQAELDAAGQPVLVSYKIKNIEQVYSTDSISQIIIRYDSTLNLSSRAVELIPSRFSFARKLGKSDTLDIVFSMKLKDILNLNRHLDSNSLFFAPTIQIKNDKTNSSLFDSENKNSLLGYIKQNKLGSFPYLNYQKSTSYFGDDCDPKGRINSELIIIEKEELPIQEKYALDPTTFSNLPVFYLKGQDPNKIKSYAVKDRDLATVLDPKTETFNPSAAEIDAAGQPAIVSYKLVSEYYSQFTGITDLFIKRQYRLDPILGINVAQPTHLGFAQQMPGQSKPTLIIEVPLEPSSDPYNSERGYPELISKLPKLQPNILINQPWLQAILMNEVEKQGELIEATDIKKLQKKFQFLKKMVSLDGEMEVSNEPHF